MYIHILYVCMQCWKKKKKEKKRVCEHFCGLGRTYFLRSIRLSKVLAD